MAEIEEGTIITKAALNVPLVLADNLDEAAKAATNLINVLKNINTSIGGAQTTTKVKDEVEKLTTAEKELENIQFKIAKAQAQNNEAYIKEQKALAAVKQEIKDKIALGERDALTVNKQNASIELLGASLRKNQAAYAALATEEERASSKGLILKNVIDQQDKEFKELNVSIGKTNVNVGNYSGGIIEAYGRINKLNIANKELIVLQGKLNPLIAEEKLYYNQLNVAIQNNLTEINQYNTAIGNTKNKIASLAGQFLSAAGLIGGVYAVIQQFKNFVAVNSQLEKSLSDLQALTGVTSEDLLVYRDAAISIGVESKRSASSIVEAFKLIGGARPELLGVKEDLIEVTRQAAILANASGLELPEAADALAGALNQLQLPAKAASEVVNVFAAAAKEGAAEIPDLNASLKQFGAVLKDSNGSIQEGSALIEVLADRQIKGAEAGTALRNVLLKLAAVDVLPKSAKQQLNKFGVDLKVVGDATLPLNVRLRELGKIAGDASALVKVFGVENYVAGNIVLNNIPRFEQLTKAVTGTNEAVRQAAVANDNLVGDVNQVKASVEALASELGGHIQSTLRFIVQGFGTFINVLRALPKFIADNKGLFIALAGAILALNANLITTTFNTLVFNASQVITVARLKAARLATIEFFTTLAANPFGLVVLGITALLVALAEYDKYSERATNLNKLTESTNKSLTEEINRTTQAYDDLTISIDDYVKLTDSQQQSVNEQVEFQKRYSLVMLERIKAQRASVAATAEELTGFQKLKIALLSAASSSTAAGVAIIKAGEYGAENVKEATSGLDDQIKQLEANIKKFDDFITDTGEARADEQEKQDAKEKDNAYKLAKFRLELAIKNQNDILSNDLKSADERYKANVKAIAASDSLAKLEREHELSNAKITASEIILAKEKYEAQLTENARLGAKNREGLDKTLLENNRKYQEEFIKSNIATNNNIIANDAASYEERYIAIEDNYNQRKALLDIQYQKDQEAAKGNHDLLLAAEAKYQSDLTALQSGTQDGKFALIEKNIKQNIAAKQAELDVEVALIQDNAVKEKKVNEETDALILAAKKKNAQAIVEENISLLRKVLDDDSLTAEERVKLEEELAKLKIKLSEETYNSLKSKDSDYYKELAKKVQAIQGIYENFTQSIGDLFQSITDKRLQGLDQEEKALSAKTKRELDAAGDNELAKAEIQKRADAQKAILDRRRIDALRKQAKYEKAQAIVSAGIATALAVLNALSTVKPYPLAVVAAISAGIAGAVQIAAIASKPLPAYEKGIKSAPGGLSLVGEKGTEMLVAPSGKIGFTPSIPTVMDIAPGTEVIPHDETMRKLAIAAMVTTDKKGNRQDSILSREMINVLDKVNSSINNIQFPDLISNGATVYKAMKAADKQSKIIKGYNMGKWL